MLPPPPPPAPPAAPAPPAPPKPPGPPPPPAPEVLLLEDNNFQDEEDEEGYEDPEPSGNASIERDFLDAHPEERYERIIVISLLHDPTLFSRYIMATKPFTQGSFRELDNPLNAVAAQVISALYVEQFPTSSYTTPLKIPRIGALVPIVRQVIDLQGPEFLKTLDECVEHVFQVFSYPKTQVKVYEEVLKWSIEGWLLKRLQAQVDREWSRKIFIPGEASQLIFKKRSIETRLRNAFPTEGVIDPLVPQDLLQALVTIEDYERLATGFPELDTACEGGFVRGKTWWIAGVRGSGKSTLTLQFALNWMFSNHNGLIISTEMDAAEVAIKLACSILALPVGSARHAIHYSLLDKKNKVWKAPGGYVLTAKLQGNPVKALTESQMSQLEILFDLFRKRCYFVDFRGQPGAKLPSQIRELYQERLPAHFDKLGTGPPKWVLFDWPALCLRGLGDAEATREAYKNIIAETVNLSKASEANVASVVVGQLNMSEAWGKKLLTEANSPDSKQLGPPLDGIACISALLKGDGEDGNNLLSTSQWLNISKNRYGKTGPVPLNSEFEYSRFKTSSWA